MRSSKRQRSESARSLDADPHCKPLIRRGLRPGMLVIVGCRPNQPDFREAFSGVIGQCRPQLFGKIRAFVGPFLGPSNARENIFFA